MTEIGYFKRFDAKENQLLFVKSIHLSIILKIYLKNISNLVLKYMNELILYIQNSENYKNTLYIYRIKIHKT